MMQIIAIHDVGGFFSCFVINVATAVGSMEKLARSRLMIFALSCLGVLVLGKLHAIAVVTCIFECCHL